MSNVEELERLYISKRIGFLEYIEKVVELGVTGEIILSNRISQELILLANKGRGEQSPCTTEKESLLQVKRVLSEAYPNCKVVEVATNSILDVGWKADLILFPNTQIGIPIQVKSSKSFLRAFRGEMKRKGRLPINLSQISSLLPELTVYIQTPASTRPHYNLSEEQQIQLMARDVGYDLHTKKAMTA